MIMEEGEIAYQSICGTHVEDDTPAASQHTPGSLLGNVKNPVEIDRHDGAPLIRRDIQKAIADADASVIDEHVQATKNGIQLLKCRCD